MIKTAGVLIKVACFSNIRSFTRRRTVNLATVAPFQDEFDYKQEPTYYPRNLQRPTQPHILLSLALNKKHCWIHWHDYRTFKTGTVITVSRSVEKQGVVQEIVTCHSGIFRCSLSFSMSSMRSHVVLSSKQACGVLFPAPRCKKWDIFLTSEIDNPNDTQ